MSSAGLAGGRSRHLSWLCCVSHCLPCLASPKTRCAGLLAPELQGRLLLLACSGRAGRVLGWLCGPGGMAELEVLQGLLLPSALLSVGGC